MSSQQALFHGIGVLLFPVISILVIAGGILLYEHFKKKEMFTDQKRILAVIGIVACTLLPLRFILL